MFKQYYFSLHFFIFENLNVYPKVYFILHFYLHLVYGTNQYKNKQKKINNVIMKNIKM